MTEKLITPQFKLGLLPPKNAPSLKLKDFLQVVPEHPLLADNLKDLTAWQMLGNDRYGDCAAVFWANMRRLMSAQVGKEFYPPLKQVLEIYETQNPGFPQQDDGMDLQTLFEYLTKNPGPDGVKLLAFAKVDTTNKEEVDAAVSIFGGIGMGIQVQADNQQDFANGVPWDYHPDEPVEGGHAVLGGGYSADVNDELNFITWGAETTMTKSFWNNLVNCPDGQCWVCIWPEHLGTKPFQDGIDQQKLADAYQEITGRPFPVNVPSPLPNPSPIPNPTPDPDPSNNDGCLSVFKALFGGKK